MGRCPAPCGMAGSHPHPHCEEVGSGGLEGGRELRNHRQVGELVVHLSNGGVDYVTTGDLVDDVVPLLEADKEAVMNGSVELWERELSDVRHLREILALWSTGCLLPSLADPLVVGAAPLPPGPVAEPVPLDQHPVGHRLESDALRILTNSRPIAAGLFFPAPSSGQSLSGMFRTFAEPGKQRDQGWTLNRGECSGAVWG
jgi:hypothetical protein